MIMVPAIVFGSERDSDIASHVPDVNCSPAEDSHKLANGTLDPNVPLRRSLWMSLGGALAGVVVRESDAFSLFNSSPTSVGVEQKYQEVLEKYQEVSKLKNEYQKQLSQAANRGFDYSSIWTAMAGIIGGAVVSEAGKWRKVSKLRCEHEKALAEMIEKQKQEVAEKDEEIRQQREAMDESEISELARQYSDTRAKDSQIEAQTLTEIISGNTQVLASKKLEATSADNGGNESVYAIKLKQQIEKNKQQRIETIKQIEKLKEQMDIYDEENGSNIDDIMKQLNEVFVSHNYKIKISTLIEDYCNPKNHKSLELHIYMAKRILGHVDCVYDPRLRKHNVNNYLDVLNELYKGRNDEANKPLEAKEDHAPIPDEHKEPQQRQEEYEPALTEDQKLIRPTEQYKQEIAEKNSLIKMKDFVIQRHERT